MVRGNHWEPILCGPVIAHIWVELCSYIIDLEDACQLGDKCAPKRFIPALDFRFWGVAGPGINCNSCGLDPMVPYGDNTPVDPDDATLEKMAADAVGKELVFGQ